MSDILTVPEIIGRVEKALAEKPRAFDWHEGHCMYTVVVNDIVCHCAVGEFLLPEHQTPEFKYNGSVIAELATESGVESIDLFLILQVRGYPLQFWRDLQDFHDEGGYWDKNPDNEHGHILNQLGQITRDELIAEYAAWDPK